MVGWRRRWWKDCEGVENTGWLHGGYLGEKKCNYCLQTDFKVDYSLEWNSSVYKIIECQMDW